MKFSREEISQHTERMFKGLKTHTKSNYGLGTDVRKTKYIKKARKPCLKEATNKSDGYQTSINNTHCLADKLEMVDIDEHYSNFLSLNRKSFSVHLFNNYSRCFEDSLISFSQGTIKINSSNASKMNLRPNDVLKIESPLIDDDIALKFNKEFSKHCIKIVLSTGNVIFISFDVICSLEKLNLIIFLE